MTARPLSLAAACLVMLGDRLASVSAQVDTDIQVVADTVTFQGTDSILGLEGMVDRFLGIRYGKAPVGDLRFKDPEPFTYPDNTVVNATEFGPQCPQFPIPDEPMEEDCLTLNVYRPVSARDSDELRPVAIFMHGGGFEREDASEFAGDDLANYGDLIYVGANFRLGALGFLFHEALDEDSDKGTSGNYGIRDMILALQWIQDNIHFFGGDPNQVTLHGQSAGAIGIGFLLVVPEAKGLFKRVIMESYAVVQGNSAPALGPLYWNAEKQRTISDLALDIIGCRRDTNEEIVECLRAADFNDFLQFSDRDRWDELFPNLGLHVDHHMWGPTEDGVLVKDDPLFMMQRGEFLDVGIMAGTNAEEGTNWEDLDFLVNATEAEMRQQLQIDFPDVYLEAIDAYAPFADLDSSPGYHYARMSQTDQYLACPMRRMVDIMSDANPNQETYLFVFNHTSSWRANGFANDPRFLIVHKSELPYVFGEFEEAGDLRQGTPEEVQLHLDVMSYITNFIRTGKPGFDDRNTLEWPKYDSTDRRAMVWEPELHVEQFYKQTECDFWDSHTPVSAAAVSTSSTTSASTISAIVLAVATGVLLLVTMWLLYERRKTARSTTVFIGDTETSGAETATPRRDSEMANTKYSRLAA